MTASAVKTGVTDYVPVARSVNNKAITDVPFGKYHPRHTIDTEDISSVPTVKK